MSPQLTPTLKLVERALVKDYANIPRADTLLDPQIDAMIEQISRECEDICRRKFAYSQYTEYKLSYEQTFYDPDPQYIWTDAWPIDIKQPMRITWAPYSLHNTAGFDLQPNDFSLAHADRGLIVVSGATGLANGLLPGWTKGRIYAYAPRGFRITYSGGYVVNNPDGESLSVDPLDDFGVVQVPRGLKMVLAMKVALDWRDFHALMPWSQEEMLALRPYKKKDMLT